MYLSSVVKPRYATQATLQSNRKTMGKPECKERIVNVFCALNGYSEQEIMKKFKETKKYFNAIERLYETAQKAIESRNWRRYRAVSKGIDNLRKRGHQEKEPRIFTYFEIKKAWKLLARSSKEEMEESVENP